MKNHFAFSGDSRGGCLPAAVITLASGAYGLDRDVKPHLNPLSAFGRDAGSALSAREGHFHP